MARSERGGGGLPLPDFYDPANAGRWSHRADEAGLFQAARAYRERHAVPPAAEDAPRVHLLLIDMQRDFCLPEGALYVGGRSGRGAVEDSDRTARFIYANLDRITRVTVTLDTHSPFQIFSPAFWVDAEGRPLAPHTTIETARVRAGDVRPDPALAPWLARGDAAWLRRQAEHYCEALEEAGRYTLYLWPPHCLLGGEGHTLVGVIQEARLFHAFVRSAPAGAEIKGGHPLTENYSVFAPEVTTRHDAPAPLAERNERFLDELLESERIVVAGQAASHCVKSSVDDLLVEIRRRDPALAGRVYILADCMSAVAVPDPERPGAFVADFTGEAEAALARFAEAGMRVVRSTTPVAEWPGFLD